MLLIVCSPSCSSHPLNLTARQYGEVVLPDEASGQCPGTLARKLSRCKEGLARVFAVMVQILLSSGAIAVQFRSEPRTYHQLQIWSGALAQCRDTMLIEARILSRYIGFKLQAEARVRVQEPLRICLECRSKSKKCDKQLTHIVRVSVS